MKVDITLNPKQKTAWDLMHDPSTRRLYYGGAAGGGKSYFECIFLIKQALRYPKYKGFIGRKELKRLMLSTYQTFRKVSRDIFHLEEGLDWKLDGIYHVIKFSNGSSIDLLDLDALPSDPDYQRFGSLEYTQGAIDEAGEIDQGAYAVIGTRVGRHMNKEFGLAPIVLCTGNPSKNWTYSDFYLRNRKGNLPEGHFFIQALVEDARGFIDDAYIEGMRALPEGPMKERLYRGNWDYADDELALFKGEDIKDIFDNILPQSNEYSERYLVIDVARFGADSTVYTVWYGLKCVDIIKREKDDTVKTANFAYELMAKHMIPRQNTCVDEGGVGGGVVDMLKGCRPFNGGASPLQNTVTGTGEYSVLRKEEYLNLRSQCYFKLSEMVKDRMISVVTKDPEMIEQIHVELSAIKSAYEFTDTRKLQVIAKDKIKKSIGKSPDVADALMMRMMFELSPLSSFTPTKIWKPRFFRR